MVLNTIHSPLVKPLNATARALNGFYFKKNYGFTYKRAARLAGCSLGYLLTLSRINSVEREMVARGEIPLSRLHNASNGNGQISDLQLDQLILKLGIDRVWRSFERLTKVNP